MNFGEFSDEEIRHELALLGYRDVPQDKLEDFKRDLMQLITKERSHTNSLNSSRVTEPEVEEEKQHFVKGQEKDESSNNFASQSHGKPSHQEDWYYQGIKQVPPPSDDDEVIPTDIHTNQKPVYKENWHYHGSRPYSAPPAERSPTFSRRNDYYNLPSSVSKLCRSHQEMNQSNCVADDVSETSSDSRAMKRKTCRKAPNGCRHVDESFCDAHADLFEIYEKIRNLALRECDCGKNGKPQIEPPYRIHGKNPNPSVIRKKEPPHTRNLIRTNINERHRMYKDIWQAQPPIGDDRRLKLRKSVHAKMMKHQDIKLKQKIYVPNSYVPPHEKLRKEVRWKVKQAFENYELPETGFYHDV